MAAKECVVSVNEKLARQINPDAREHPNSPYAGKLIGIARGQAIVMADSWPEVVARLRQAEPDPAQCYCLDANEDYDRVDELWGGM